MFFQVLVAYKSVKTHFCTSEAYDTIIHCVCNSSRSKKLSWIVAGQSICLPVGPG